MKRACEVCGKAAEGYVKFPDKLVWLCQKCLSKKFPDKIFYKYAEFLVLN